MTNWDRRFMELARYVGYWSKDRSRRVGCVIVGPGKDVRATGYNGFPRGISDDDDDRHQRPAKYAWTEHAERNAIYNAARSGVSTNRCTMYVPWYPCMDCARAIIQSGIQTLVAQTPDWSDKTWGEEFALVARLFQEAITATDFKLRFLDADSSETSHDPAVDAMDWIVKPES